MTLRTNEVSEGAAGAMGAPLRVLLVEDSENDALLLLRELRRGGYKPICERVETPEAMEAALEGEAWDAIISDYYLPRFSAPAALEVLREKGLDLPFIVVSGKMGEEAAVEMMRAGAHDYVTKENMARLCPAIERELQEAEVRRDRQRSDAALRESEERFRLLVEGVKDYAIFMLDPEGHITTWNEGTERIYGYKAEEILGKHFSVFYTEEDIERGHPEEELRVAATEGRYEEEGLRIRKDGSWFWASVLITALRDEAGDLRGFSKVVRDITERKTAEEALRMSERRFRTMVEQSPLSIQILSPDGRTLQVNQAWERLWGVTLEDIAGYNLLEDRQLVDNRVMPYLRRAFAGEPTAIPPTLYDPEETIPDITSHKEPRRWVQAFAYPVKDEAGNIREVVLIHEDVTERKHTEEALRQSEELYRTVVEQAAENIFLVDLDSKRILEVNTTLSRSLGYSHEELKRMTLYDIVAHDQESIDRNVELLIAEKQCFLGERQYRRKDGSLVDVEVSVSVISHGGREAISVVAHDITERKRTQWTLHEIREAERNRMARDLHDGVLQDLSYTALAMQVTRLKAEGTGLEAELEQEMDDIRRAVSGLREAVYDLRLGEENRPFLELVESLVEQNRRRTPDRDIWLNVEEDLPSASLGHVGTELLRIVQEALTNARRHSGARHVRVTLWAEGNELVAEVSDDGRGFETETAPGIGLRSMRERAAALGGELQVQSEPGEGTRVRLRVPMPGLLRG